MLRPATRLAAQLLLACALAQGTASALVVDGGVDNTFAMSPWGDVWGWGGNVGGKLGNGTTMNTSMPVLVSAWPQLELTAGFYHTCAWNQDTGAASCWGWNANGQLGDDSTTDRWVETAVYGLSSGVMGMAAGTWHTCALTTEGGVKCWGNNFYGQLGTIPGFESHVPVDLPSLPSGVAAIAAGETHTCALTTEGGVKCWGGNDSGQLGQGNTTPQPSPVDVPGLTSGVAAITTGLYHTCVLTTAGPVKCWGRNANGQLGINSTTNALSPTALPDLPNGVVSISAGSYHTCAILTAGTAQCWGANAGGQLGDNSTTQRLKPVGVHVLSGVLAPVAIQPGFDHTCALTVLRQVFCWGGNTLGEVGDNTITQRRVPTATWYLGANVANLVVAGTHACATYKFPGLFGSVYCWGQNNHGQLGDNTNVNKHVPTYANNLASNLMAFRGVAVSAGMSHTLAISLDGTVWAWGSNHRGQLGVGRDKAPQSCFTPNDSTINCSTLAIRVPGLTGIVAVGAGWGHSIALKEDGSVWAWGDNQFGQLGSGGLETGYTPRRVLAFAFAFPPPLGGISQIAAGYFHNVALKESNGTLLAWGRGESGQLGNGFFETSTYAEPVSTLSGVEAISSKGSHTLALVAGDVFAWGLNSYGQVGNSSALDVASPVLVQSDVVEISAGMSTSMTRRSFPARPYAWGLNTQNQLGTSSSNSCSGFLCQTLPKQLSQFSSPEGIAAAGAHGIVIRNDGILAMFGDNSSGQLADRSGNFPDIFDQVRFDPLGKLTPLIVAPTGTSISVISSGTGISLDTLGASIDFGKNQVGSDSGIGIPLQNLDPTAITFNSITVSGGGFRINDPHGCPATLDTFATCTITLWYNPGNVDTHYGMLEILSNAVDNETLRFGLIGAGVGAPTAPTNVVATAGNESAIVTFDPPSSNGGIEISYYTVTATPGGVNPTGTDPNGISVPGLINGTAYTFKVTATNLFNLTGPASAASNSVTPRAQVSSNVVASSLNPSPYQTAVTFTATLAGASGTPTGTITFRDGANTIAGCEAVALSAGIAQCITSGLQVGTRSITAQYSGSSSYSGSTSSAFSQAVQPALTSVTLTHTHGDAGFFSVAVDVSQSLGGAVTVDPRTGFNDGSRTLFFNFNSGYSTALVTTTAGQVTPYSYGPTGVGMIVQVPDNTRFTVTLSNINGTSQTVSASMAFLVGDANNSRSVTSADIDAIKAQTGADATSGNFRHDANRSGAITAADILAAKGRLGLSVP